MSTTVVFGIEILIHRIEFLKVESFPSLTIKVDKCEPKILLPFSREAHSGDIWDEEKAFQMIHIIDAFESCVSYPFTLELVSPVATTALGRCSFELKPLICDAIAAHGCSPIACQSSYMKDFEKKEVAQITFDIRTVFMRMCLKRAATTNAQVKNTSKRPKQHALSVRTIPDSDLLDNLQGGTRKVFAVATSPHIERQRRESFQPKAMTESIHPFHKRHYSSTIQPF